MSEKLKFILLVLFLEIFSFFKTYSDENFLAVKNVSFSQENDEIYNLVINFYENITFSPRIHVLPNGVKIILSFDKPVSLPNIGKTNHGVVKGYFFEKFGTSSLMFIMALNSKAEFIKKKYTKNSIKLSFKIPHKYTIVIDAGHGGKDPGTKSQYDNCLEKNITLVTAIELRNALLKTKKYNVILTRDSDKFIAIDDRLNFINEQKADFVISLHTDYNPDKKLSGMSVYTLPKTNIEGVSKTYHRKLEQSQKFANYLVKYVPKFFKIKKHTCRNSDLKILKNDSPTTLIEMGCLSNSKDSKLLLSKLFREKFIYAILYALDRFFEKGMKK